jgi:hypothetical protein
MYLKDFLVNYPNLTCPNFESLIHFAVQINFITKYSSFHKALNSEYYFLLIFIQLILIQSLFISLIFKILEVIFSFSLLYLQNLIWIAAKPIPT